MTKLLWWLTERLRVRVIHVDGQPYLERYLLLRAFGLTAYLHHFVRGDSERWLHDHPWPWAFAIVLAGGYHEERWRYLCPVAGLVVHEVPVRWWNLIRARDFHRIVRTEPGTWTLFIHPRRDGKGWGFVQPLAVSLPYPGAMFSYQQPFEGEDGDAPTEGFKDAMTGRELRRERELERLARMVEQWADELPESGFERTPSICGQVVSMVLPPGHPDVRRGDAVYITSNRKEYVT